MKKVILIALLSVFVLNVSVASAKEASPAKSTEAAVVTATELKGIVFDKSTNETLAGAAITINGKKLYTDLDGNFTLPDGVNGSCELKISMISYEDKVLTVDFSKQTSLKIELNQR